MVPSRDTVVNGLNVRNQGNCECPYRQSVSTTTTLTKTSRIVLQLEGVGKIRGYMVGSTPVSATPNVLLLSYDG